MDPLVDSAPLFSWGACRQERNDAAARQAGLNGYWRVTQEMQIDATPLEVSMFVQRHREAVREGELSERRAG